MGDINLTRNNKLIEFRKSLNKTIEEMAVIIEISASYYRKIEAGLRNPSFNFIQKFKSKFDVNADEIFFEDKSH